MKIIKQHFEVLSDAYYYETFASRIEEIARVCYKSEGKINEQDEGQKFVRSLIKSGHEAMLEHCSLSIKFITDRATANAIVRHRHCAFAQESTHFIPYAKRADELTFVVPNTWNNKPLLNDMLITIEQLYMDAYKAKENTKALRGLLPLCFKTEIVVTTNLREWRSILKLRTTEHAHPQMRALMRSVLDWFKEELPVFVEDIDYEV